MKIFRWLLIPVLSVALFSSCSSVQVVSDYDNEVNFSEYNTYAFYKTGIDKAQISDLDKKRILRAIETEMAARGFVKSENPDVLVSIFTREREQVDVYNYPYGWGWGWGGYWGGYWGPGWGWGGYWGPSVSSYTEGSLYIDLIDATSRQLVWQGKGVGTLSSSKKIEKKEQRIQEFVAEILQQYPPDALVSN